MFSKTTIVTTVYLFCSLFLFGQAQTNDEISNVTLKRQNIGKEEMASIINDLGYKIVTNMMGDRNDRNIVISPIGIAGLLAMTLLGCVGKSYDELAKALGFSQDVRINRDNHEQFGELLKSLNSNDTYSKTMYADAIFVDAQTRLREAFQGYLNRVYNGEAMTVDFAAGETVKTVINEWVNNHTSGKISDFLKDPLPGDTKAVLLSALYFSGQWETPFIPEYTMNLPFKKTYKEITADLMMTYGSFRYITSFEDHFHMIALPYNDSTTTMYALKPLRHSHQNLNELMSKLNYKKINDLIDKMQSKKSIIRFPKMDLKFGANIKDPLQSLGVQSIFIPGQANFALMIENNNEVVNKTENEFIARINDEKYIDTDLRSIIDDLPNPGVHVDSIIHDVRIKIDEYGTEAAAATIGILARTAELFYADSPFYMFIRNEKTKFVTFSAVIFDPTS